LRFKIPARDVRLSLQAEEHSSILNRLPATVTPEIPSDNARTYL